MSDKLFLMWLWLALIAFLCGMVIGWKVRDKMWRSHVANVHEQLNDLTPDEAAQNPYNIKGIY